MKIRNIGRLVIALFIAFSSSALSQLSSQDGRIITKQDALNKFVGRTYTWVHYANRGREETVTFHKDGTVAHLGGFIGRYQLSHDFRTVTMRVKKQTSKIMFDPTYTSFTGSDYGNRRPVSGSLIQ